MDSEERTTRTPLLEVVDLSKHYGGVMALSGACITLDGGEVIALCGDNGAGKSTLAQCIAGVVTPSEGVIRIDGIAVHLRQPSDARGAGIETVYQTLALADDLDAVDNLYLGREITQRVLPLLDKRRMRRAGRGILLKYGLPEQRHFVPVRELSGGQRQAIAIGRAVEWGSRIVIMDEPSAALGVRERARVADLVMSMKTQGVGVVIISHNLEEVFQLADRIYVLRHGKVRSHFRVSETSTTEVVHAITGA